MGTFHVSVLAEPLSAALAPAIDAHPAAAVVDATCGAGGHSAAILRRSQPGRVVLLDRDPAALEHAQTQLVGARCPLDFVHTRFAVFADALDALQIGRVAALLADIGVSSHQLDSGERGFSFRADAPLDMRMDPTQGQSAGELLAHIEARELSQILRRYGDEPDAKRIAAAIVVARPRRTGELAHIVEHAMSARSRRAIGKRIHPATRTFQALRIHVNGELDELAALLEGGPERLLPGGRMAVITFHSLEERMVKRRFSALCRPPHVPAELPLRADQLPRASFTFIPGISRKGLRPDAAELARNPRSRSATLHVLERVAS